MLGRIAGKTSLRSEIAQSLTRNVRIAASVYPVTTRRISNTEALPPKSVSFSTLSHVSRSAPGLCSSSTSMSNPTSTPDFSFASTFSTISQPPTTPASGTSPTTSTSTPSAVPAPTATTSPTTTSTSTSTTSTTPTTTPPIFPDGTYPATIAKIEDIGFVKRFTNRIRDKVMSRYADSATPLRFYITAGTMGLAYGALFHATNLSIQNLQDMEADPATIANVIFAAGATHALALVGMGCALTYYLRLEGRPSEAVIQEVIRTIQEDPRIHLTIGGNIKPGAFTTVGTTMGGPRIINTKRWRLRKWLELDRKAVEETGSLPRIASQRTYVDHLKPLEMFTDEGKEARAALAKETEDAIRENKPLPNEKVAAAVVAMHAAGMSNSMTSNTNGGTSFRGIANDPMMGMGNSNAAARTTATTEPTADSLLEGVKLTDAQALERRVDAELTREAVDKAAAERYANSTDPEEKAKAEAAQVKKRTNAADYNGWERFWRARRMQLVMHVKADKGDAVILAEVEKYHTGIGVKGSGGFSKYLTLQVIPLFGDQTPVTIEGPEEPALLGTARMTQLFDTVPK